MFIMIESVRSAFSAIRSNKLRSVLTSLGIIIGVMSTIAVISLIQGLRSSVLSEFEGFGANQVIVFPQPSDEAASYGLPQNITVDDYQAVLDAIDGFAEATAQVSVFGGRIGYGEQSSGASVTGVYPEQYIINDQNIEYGRPTVAGDGTARNPVMVVGQTVLNDLEIPADEAVGKYVEFNGDWFLIVGVLEKVGASFGQDRDNVVYIPFEVAAQQSAFEPSVIIFVSVFETDNVPFVLSRIKLALRLQHGISGDMPDDFQTFTGDQAIAQIDAITGVLTAVFGGVVAISLLVGGIGIMNIMLVSVTERTREIGICKALGATRAQILLQFLIEAVVLCLVGGVIGILLGAGIGLGIAPLIPGFEAQAVIPLWAIGLALGFSTGVGVIFGILPAAKAASLDPIDALRYE